MGVGFGTTSLVYGSTVAGSSGIASHEQGVAGAVMNATRQIGAALGVAALASLVTVTNEVGADTSTLAGELRIALALACGLVAMAALISLAAPGLRTRER